MMRILLASSEVYPYSKTGGLADMVGALGKALARSGHQVGLVTPLYLGARERWPALKRLGATIDFPLGVRNVAAEFWTLEPLSGLTLYFVDQPDFFQRADLYQCDGVDYPDNAERFMLFSKAVAHLALHLPWAPEIVHAHDWQAGLAVLLLHHQRRQQPAATVPRTCMTIHNLAYQGLFPASQYALSNLPWDYFSADGVEFYGQVSCLKAGITFADAVTTVSPRYAREITTSEYGCGFEGLLRERQSRLFGILNGVDYDEWDPSHNNGYVKHAFSAEDLRGKAADKLELQKEFGLPPDPSIPLFGNIGRMVEQKGVDILLAALEQMLGTNIQFVQIGSGVPKFQQAFLDLARRHPQRASVRIGFDEALSHRIEAGCDFFLMPSRFEPCGLNQMYSLRYGTIPIARATGGLDDTIVDARDNPERANGIKFHDYSAGALAKAIQKALALYEADDLFQRFRQNAMAARFSWDQTAQRFIEAYRTALGAGNAP